MKVTLKDIAERAGVSINTVSLALRNMPNVQHDTRKRIFDIANELGYFSRKKIVEAKNLCLVSKADRLNDTYFYMNFYQNILNKARNYNYNMLVYTSAGCDIPVQELKKNFEANSIKGIILLGDMEESIVRKILKCEIPVVAIGAKYHELPICSFIEDNLEGAYVALRHLHDRGYRKIGFIGSPIYSTSFMERYQGYCGAIFQLGLTMSREYNITDINHNDENCHMLIEKQLREMEEIPEAFLCANDYLAILTTKALYSLGLSVPEDVALVGFDYSSQGRMFLPAVTSVDVQYELQADVVLKTLMAFIRAGQYDEQCVMLPIAFQEADSVGDLTEKRV